jgi:hypothetical protein
MCLRCNCNYRSQYLFQKLNSIPSSIITERATVDSGLNLNYKMVFFDVCVCVYVFEYMKYHDTLEHM